MQTTTLACLCLLLVATTTNCFPLSALLTTKNLDLLTQQQEFADPTYPVWPLQFNCTLQKIEKGDATHTVHWTKLFYDFVNQRTKFEFYDYYVDPETNKFGPTNFVILFINQTIYFVEPKISNCTIRARDIPTISPHWLRLSVYKGRTMFRGLYSDLWEFPPGTGVLEGIQYYHRVGYSDATKIPLRSTNQQGDPGVTDYTDFVVGAQDAAEFEVPHYCPK